MVGVAKPRMDDNTCFHVKLYTFILLVAILSGLYDDIWRVFEVISSKEGTWTNHKI